MPRPPKKSGDENQRRKRPADVDLSPRARQIRDMIEAGTYDVDFDALAEAIARSGDLERVGPDTSATPANDEHVDERE